jgi:hypothetical protein
VSQTVSGKIKWLHLRLIYKVFEHCPLHSLTLLDSSLEGNSMTQYTIYAYIGEKHRRHPCLTISNLPVAWFGIKEIVKDAAIILFNDKHESNGILSIEKHLSGAYKLAWHQAGYSRKRLYFKRNIEFSCKFEFNPRTKEMKMANVQFGPTLLFAGALEDYRRIERGVWKMPSSCIPKSHENMLGNTKSLLMEPSATRYSDYSRAEKLIYQEGAERQMKWQSYDKAVSRRYMPKSLQLQEEHEAGEGEENAS